MKLIRASMNPASRTARRPADSPAGRLVSAAARADADENGTERTFLLATGVAAAATGLALVLANEQQIDELLGALEEAAGHGAETREKLNAIPVIRALLADQGSADKILGATFARDQGEFFDLILELADFAATCIFIRDARFGTPVAATMADLEEMLKTSSHLASLR